MPEATWRIVGLLSDPLNGSHGVLKDSHRGLNDARELSSTFQKTKIQFHFQLFWFSLDSLADEKTIVELDEFVFPRLSIKQKRFRNTSHPVRTSIPSY